MVRYNKLAQAWGNSGIYIEAVGLQLMSSHHLALASSPKS